jgi:hypothetical protein
MMPPDNDINSKPQPITAPARAQQLAQVMGDAAALYAHSIADLLGSQPSERAACLRAVQEGLRERIRTVHELDPAELHEDLAAQCALLNVVVVYALEQARSAQGAAAKEVYFRLMLRAQQAYARSAATLAGMLLAERQGHPREL